jgi:hypothetical protein
MSEVVGTTASMHDTLKSQELSGGVMISILMT